MSKTPFQNFSYAVKKKSLSSESENVTPSAKSGRHGMKSSYGYKKFAIYPLHFNENCDIIYRLN